MRVPSRVISLQSAVCLLGRFPALAGVDLEVDAGDVVLLAGPNGAGKTTLLRLCAGLLAVRSGRVVVLGHDLASDRRAVRRSVGMVGHETYAYDDLTVAENCGSRPAPAGRTREEADAAHRASRSRRLAGVAHGRLSQGQRRRLSLAIALARDPRLLLLDEPHAGLDAEGRAVSSTKCWRTPRPKNAPSSSCRTRSIWRARFATPRGRDRRGARAYEGRDRGRRGRAADGGRLHEIFADALLVAGKDLRIERRSRVAMQQVLPFGAIVLVLFAFALDPDRGFLPAVAPGLFWTAVLLAALLAVGRRSRSRKRNGARDGLRLSGLDGGAIFFGKAVAIVVELAVLEVVLGLGVVVLYDVEVHGVLLVCRRRRRDHRAGGHRYRLRRAGWGLRARETLCRCSCSRPSRR